MVRRQRLWEVTVREVEYRQHLESEPNLVKVAKAQDRVREKTERRNVAELEHRQAATAVVLAPGAQGEQRVVSPVEAVEPPMWLLERRLQTLLAQMVVRALPH